MLSARNMLVMAKFTFFSGPGDSARQNVSPEGREGGEDTGVCGNIFQSRLSLENAQKPRHRICPKIQASKIPRNWILLNPLIQRPMYCPVIRKSCIWVSILVVCRSLDNVEIVVEVAAAPGSLTSRENPENNF